jgi:polyphosphate kinase 2 (PPK2 family)
VPSNDERRARLNCIVHFLSQIPYKPVKRKPIDLPKRDKDDAYDDEASIAGRRFVPQQW